MQRKVNIRVALVTAVLGGVISASAQDYDIDWHTIDGGGVMWSSGGAFELSGTIGQPDAGPGTPGMNGGDFTLTGGFWFPLATGDCNTDGGVNLLDYSDFEPCLSGPDGGLLMPECDCFDIDNDEDVDLSDVAQFQQSFTG
jgi:hypothetical protein